MKVPSQPILTLILASLAALAPFAIDTYLPAFPAIGLSLHAQEISLQESLTFYLFPYALMTLWHGAISDSIGRITTIKWGLGIFILASIGCAFATSIHQLWFFRALQGFSGGAGNVVSRAMVRDLFEGPKAQKVMATVQMLFGIAPAVAPIIGGVLLGIHWQAIFIFLAGYGALSLSAAVYFLPETVPPAKRLPLSFTQVIKDYRLIFSDREFLRLAIASGANFSAFFVYVLGSPIFLMKHLGLSHAQFGYMFIPTVTGMMMGSYLSRRDAGVVTRQKSVQSAYLWMFLMVLVNLWMAQFLFDSSYKVPLLIAPIALFNIGMARALPVLSIAALDRHPRVRGTAASAQAFIQMLLSTVTAGLVVPLVWAEPIGLALTMSVYFGLSAIILFKSHLWQAK
jgi:MFS transporter, DHA1 family, multidrug resistance protein